MTTQLSRALAITGMLLALLFGFILATTTPARAGERDNDRDNDDDNKNKAAQNSNDLPRDVLSDKATNTPAHITINKQGKATLTSVDVTESNWPNLKVKAWGTVYSVHVMPDAKITGATNTGTTTPLVTVAIGDKVDFVGDVELATGLIHAKSFRNRSAVNKQSSDLQMRIKQLMEEIERLRSQLNDIRKSAGGTAGRAFWN